MFFRSDLVTLCDLKTQVLSIDDVIYHMECRSRWIKILVSKL